MISSTKKRDIKEMVRDNKMVTFTYYRAGNLYYKTECGLEFPVPISDAGEATFNAKEKAMLMMRYIRLYLKELEG